MSKKKEIKKTTSNITPRVEKRIIELHQKNKLGAPKSHQFFRWNKIEEVIVGLF